MALMTNEERIRELLKNAEKFDGLSFIKERIANREQLRKERKEKLKELMEKETKQTAVDWLIQNLIESYDLTEETFKEFEQAKEMEKIQQQEYYNQGFSKAKSIYLDQE